jgi:hypothetical protein
MVNQEANEQFPCVRKNMQSEVLDCLVQLDPLVFPTANSEACGQCLCAHFHSHIEALNCQVPLDLRYDLN